MSASELAVHRKKVQEVEEWLKWALDPARQSSREVRELLIHYMCVPPLCVTQHYCSCCMHVKSLDKRRHPSSYKPPYLYPTSSGHHTESQIIAGGLVVRLHPTLHIMGGIATYVDLYG